MLYKKYNQYHPYSCDVENNIAVHYFNNEEFERSANYVKKVLERNNSSDSKCLNPMLLKLLKEKKLI